MNSHCSPLCFPLTVARLFLLLACGLLLASPATAIHTTNSQQEDMQGTSVWLFAAPSMTSQGPGAAAGLSIDRNQHLFTVRTSFIGTEPFSGTWDTAVLYGRSTVLGWLYLSGSTGVAVTAGDRYTRVVGGSVKSDFEPTIGFPVEGHASIANTRGLAIGLYAFANVNTWQPFGGIGIAVRMGRL